MKHTFPIATAIALALAALLAVVAVGPASAQPSHESGPDPSAQVRQVILESPASSPATASGFAKLGWSEQWESLRVRVFADLPDGSVLTVKVRRDDRPTTDPWVTVGTIEIQLGSGLLSLVSDGIYLGPAFPLDALRAIRVDDEGVTILGASL